MGRAHCLQKEETERAGGEGGQTKRADQSPESNAPAQILTESGKGKKGFPCLMNETWREWKNRELLEYLT